MQADRRRAFYPVWNGQPAAWGWHYPVLASSAQAGPVQVGVFRENQNAETRMTQVMIEPQFRSGGKLQFRFEAFYDLRLETSGLERTPFAILTRAQLQNAYVELRPGSGGVELSPAEVTLSSMLQRPAIRCFAFDYDQTGLLDHVVAYDAGYLMVYGNVGGARLERRPLAWGAGREWELKETADEVFGFDSSSSGKADHLVFYRPGAGKISVFKNDHGVLDCVWRSDGGLPGFNLVDKADRGLAFDLKSSGRLDHPVFYRAGLICIWGRSASGEFQLAYRSNNETGGYRLQDPRDRLLAFDYDGSGRKDHLVLYRPGAQMISIVKGSTFNGVTTFNPVYSSPNRGIAGFDLRSSADLALAFDCDSTGRQEYLVFYRPGGGAIFVFKKNDKGTLEPPFPG